MKKMYKKPESQIAEMMPQSIICASGEFDTTPDPITGQAPAHRGTPIPY